jgi:hypothetical protein
MRGAATPENASMVTDTLRAEAAAVGTPTLVAGVVTRAVPVLVVPSKTFTPQVAKLVDNKCHRF